MYFVGLDLAWGEKKQTGVAAVDSEGRLLHVGIAQDDAGIVDAVAPFTGDECIVAFDAPLVVNNPTGFRPAETEFNAVFHKFDAGAFPANTTNPLFNPPRGAVLASTLGLDVDPRSTANRRAIFRDWSTLISSTVTLRGGSTAGFSGSGSTVAQSGDRVGDGCNEDDVGPSPVAHRHPGSGFEPCSVAQSR